MVSLGDSEVEEAPPQANGHHHHHEDDDDDSVSSAATTLYCPSHQGVYDDLALVVKVVVVVVVVLAKALFCIILDTGSKVTSLACSSFMNGDSHHEENKQHKYSHKPSTPTIKVVCCSE